MPEVGVEPTQGCPYQILSLAQLNMKNLICSCYDLVICILPFIFISGRKTAYQEFTRSKQMARTTQGRLFKRGKQGYYYLQYYLNGKEIKRALRDETGNPITSLRKAQKAKDILLTPYSTADEKQRREQAYSALKTAEEKAIEAKKICKHTVQINGGWTVYPEVPRIITRFPLPIVVSI